MKKLLAVFMSVVMVVSLSVIAIAQSRPEVTPAQNQAGEQYQQQSSQDPSTPPTREESSDPESESMLESESPVESDSPTESDSPEDSSPGPVRTQKIEELMAGIAARRAEKIAERTMAMEENRARFEEKKQDILQRREDALQKRQEFQDKNEEFSQFRLQLKAHKDEAIKNMQENNMLRAEISRLREELKDSLLALETDGVILSDEALAEVKIYTEQIALLTEDLMSTKGSIGGAVSEGAKSRRELDYEKMTFAFEELYETQAFRNECMNKIIEALRSTLEILASEA